MKAVNACTPGAPNRADTPTGIPVKRPVADRIVREGLMAITSVLD